jgi:hypothetical protein
LGEAMIKFTIDFSLIITVREFLSIVLGLQFKRNLSHLIDLVVVHIKQAIQQDLISIIQPIIFLNVIANIRREHPNHLDELRWCNEELKSVRVFGLSQFMLGIYILKTI